ncbi:putative porin [Spirosoma aerophilum]
MKRSFLFFLFSLSITLNGWAQQFPGSTQVPGGFGGRQSMPTSTTGTNGIDDSTKVIYGPKSTRFVLEDDIFNNRRKLYTLDTTMDDVHRFTYVQRSKNLYQDLGTLGTPMRPVFLQTPQQLGAQSGYYVFSPYAYQAQDVKYFDTKSPFTDMYIALGGNNQNILRFDMSQNINPRWNVGFDVQRFTSQKQFGTSGNNDPYKLLAQNWGVQLHTNYRSKNDKYTLLANFINMNHSLDEQGGVLPGQTADGVPIPFNYTGDSRLRSGSSTVQGPHGWDIRNNWHVYHQYILEKGFQLYHKFDYQTQKNFYQDDTLSLNQSDALLTTAGNARRFYPTILGDTSRLEQHARFRLLENQFGIKGIAQYKGASFNYRAYLRIRNYKQESRYNTSRTQYNEYQTVGLETFAGGWLGYYFPDSLSRLTAEAELGADGSRRLQVQVESKFLTAGGSYVNIQPTLVQERFQSKVYNWPDPSNGLLPLIKRDYWHAYGKLNVAYRKLRLEPSLDYYLVKNYIYFDEKGVVQQENSPISIVRPGLRYHLQLGKFLISGLAYYTAKEGPDVIRMPPLFVNTRIQYEFLYAKVLYIQTGIDLHYKSKYYADAYMPLTQQYHLQNRQQVEGYVLADLYANLRINRTRLFIKLTHANQGLVTPGYYVAPDFLQIRRGFAFGVDWYLFD